jgi:L-alanine-DL-glutamate epimerase-like enolase superfamily enzyme
MGATDRRKRVAHDRRRGYAERGYCPRFLPFQFFDHTGSTQIPIAVGASMYSLSQFKDYLQNDACSIVQVDVGRIGGITPWLKVAHLAEAFNVPVCPHFLMEIHLPLCCAVPNSRWLEFIP